MIPIVYRHDRDRKGGGVCLAVKKDLYSSIILVQEENDLVEDIWISIKTSSTVIIGCIYRPPSVDNRDNNYTKAICDRTIIINRTHPKAHIVILGDLNFPNIDWERKK